jgi:hypothetical protein
MSVSQGRIRIFVVIGELLGAVLFFLTVGNPILSVMEAVSRAIGRAFVFIWRCTFAPLIALTGFLGRRLCIFYAKCAKNTKKPLKSKKIS